MLKSLIGGLLVLGVAQSALALDVPFQEDFSTDNANWFDSTDAVPSNWVSSGGPDGSGYISSSFNFVNSAVDDTPLFHRAEDEFNSSGGAFEGDWIAGGVTEFSVFVRHDAPVPLNFFSRFSGPGNFPGAIALEFQPVFPNTWTQLTFAIDANNPQFISFSGQDFATVFGASPLNGFAGIGHVQVGANVPAALAGADQSFTFDVDQVAITPEPTSAVLLLGLLALRRR